MWSGVYFGLVVSFRERFFFLRRDVDLSVFRGFFFRMIWKVSGDFFGR